MPADAITVVGIGADGWAGLSEDARATVAAADVLVGGERHLGMVPDGNVTKLSWPKPFRAGLSDLFAEHRGRRVVVLASGDPLVSGVGTTLLEMFGRNAVRVVPAVSSVALARARMGWPAERSEVVSVVGRNVHRVGRALAPGQRLLVLSSDASTPSEVARLLVERGYGASRMSVLEDLGGDDERCMQGVAEGWAQPPTSPLNVVAVECELDPGAAAWSLVPGLPDDAFEHDGQITKRDLRAGCLARLAPLPGQLLWDVGAGSGSVAIEWMRVHPANRAVAIEADPERAARIRRNAERLGVPDLRVVVGSAPEALSGLAGTQVPDSAATDSHPMPGRGRPAGGGPPAGSGDRHDAPDAVFLGGGVSVPGMVDACLDALGPGGRLVAHAVTLQAEAALTSAYATYGGELARHSVERAAPLGSLTGWTPARTLTQWSFSRASHAEPPEVGDGSAPGPGDPNDSPR